MRAVFYRLLGFFSVVTVIITFFWVRHCQDINTMNVALRGGNAKLTGLEVRVNLGATQRANSTSQESLSYMQTALGNSRRWEGGYINLRPQTALQITFLFSNGSSYSPVNTSLVQDEYLIMSVNQFDGWPTHVIKLQEPIPSEVKDLFNMHKTKTGGTKGDERDKKIQGQPLEFPKKS